MHNHLKSTEEAENLVNWDYLERWMWCLAESLCVRYRLGMIFNELWRQEAICRMLCRFCIFKAFLVLSSTGGLFGCIPVIWPHVFIRLWTLIFCAVCCVHRACSLFVTRSREDILSSKLTQSKKNVEVCYSSSFQEKMKEKCDIVFSQDKVTFEIKKTRFIIARINRSIMKNSHRK